MHLPIFACLSVCLFVYKIIQSVSDIILFMTFCRTMTYGTRPNYLDFGDDPNSRSIIPETHRKILKGLLTVVDEVLCKVYVGEKEDRIRFW